MSLFEDITMATQNITASDKTANTADLEPSQVLQLSSAPVALKYLAAVIMTALATVVAVGLDTHVTVPNLSIIFVIAVVAAAVTVGLGPSLCSAVLGALAYNFFLTEPRYSLAVDDPANVWAIGLLFVVGCIASAVASAAKRKADDAARLRRQATVLQRYGRKVAGSDRSRTLVSITADTLESLFNRPVAVIVMAGAANDAVELRGDIELLSDVETEAARSSLTSRRQVPAAVYPFDQSRFDFWPVETPAGQKAVLGLAFDPDERPATPEILVETVGSLFALALDSELGSAPQRARSTSP
jgi:two-component system sensor histidine kinase KdpD